ncbi:hypothetical protein MQB67_01135, partial [Escherichia coli]|nr:hypothetical protein [Escherichia coli]
MGKYIRPLSDAVFTIASDDLWIESLAIQQLHTTANLPNMQRVVGMPDLHPGRGYPIGAAFFSVGRFYPARRRVKWFTEFGHLNRGDMLTSEQHRCHNEKKKFQRR